MAVNTTTPAAAPTAFSVTGNSLFVTGNMGVNTTTPAVLPIVVTGNGMMTGSLGLGTSTPPIQRLVVTGNTLVTGTSGIGTVTPATADALVVSGNSYITGNVGIGTATPSEKLVVIGNAQADMFLFNSDRRLKTDIEKSPGLEQIRRLQGHSYRWIKDGRFDTGLIAQEVEKEMPHLVHTSDQGMKSVNYMGLVPVLIEGSKDLYNEHLRLLKRVEELEKQMKAMKKRNPSSEPESEEPAN